MSSHQLSPYLVSADIAIMLRHHGFPQVDIKHFWTYSPSLKCHILNYYAQGEMSYAAPSLEEIMKFLEPRFMLVRDQAGTYFMIDAFQAQLTPANKDGHQGIILKKVTGSDADNAVNAVGKTWLILKAAGLIK